MSAVPAPIDDGLEGSDVDPARPGGHDAGAGTITRSELIDRLTDKLIAESQPPTTARVLATIYATSVELDDMLRALDGAGGLPGIGGLVGRMLGGRRKA